MARNDRKKATVIGYSNDEVNAAMVRWQQASNVNARNRTWFEYVDYRDQLPIGTSYAKYLYSLRPDEAKYLLDA